MEIIGITLLALVVAITALAFASNTYTRFLLRILVVRKLEWLDFVQDTALVPPDWRVRHEKAIAKAAPNEAKVHKLKARAREDYLRRMDKTIRFAQVCTLIPSDAERARIIKNLEEIKQDWRENDEAIFTAAR